MICLGAKKNQELKKKGHMGPTFNNKKKKKNIKINKINGFR